MEKREREWRKRRGRQSEVAGVIKGCGVVRRRSEERE